MFVGVVKALLGVAFVIGAGYALLFATAIFLVQASNQSTRAHQQAYSRAQHQLALACGWSDMEIEAGAGRAEHSDCLLGVNSSNLIWNDECGRLENGPEAWARCVVARYVKQCDFILSQHAEKHSIDMILKTCAGLPTLKLWASN